MNKHTEFLKSGPATTPECTGVREAGRGQNQVPERVPPQGKHVHTNEPKLVSCCYSVC